MAKIRRTLITLLFVLLSTSIASLVNAAEVFDTSFSIGYTIPDTWKEAAAFDSDINPTFVRKAYITDGSALFLVTGQDAGSAFTADSWLSAMEQSYKAESGVTVDARSVEDFRGKQTALLRAYSETGTGSRLSGGNMPTTRLVALIPRGTSIVQFILTCPSTLFDALSEEMIKIVTDAEFRTSTGVTGAASSTRQAPAASADSRPVLSVPEKEADEPMKTSGTSPKAVTVKPVQASPGVQAPPVIDQLLKVGLHVYESAGTGAPYEYILMSPKANRAYRTIALIAVSGGYVDDQMVWRVSRAKTKDMVVLIKPSKWVGWVLPAAVFNQYAVVDGNELVLSMSRKLANGTTVAQQLKKYINPLEAFRGETR